MSYNNMSGTVFLPGQLLPRLDIAVATILSGNLSTSDAAEVINIPRVSNATNNALITNVGGDANALVCESNLTFDGTTLNVNGVVSASAGLSASFLRGDGRYLTNVLADHVIAEGSAHSIQFHDSSDGDLTGSLNLTFQNNILSISAGLVLSRRSVNSTITASATDYYIGVDTSGGALSVRLPNAGGLSSGHTYVVKDEGGASNSNKITILASGSQTIDGENSIVLESSYASVQLYSNGNSKFHIF